MRKPPPASVLAAFGIAEPPVSLSGGQGEAFRCGDLVLKPAGDAAEVAWLAKVHAQVGQTGFRMARPVPAAGGAWTIDGWWAQTVLEGQHGYDRWFDVFAACRAFHAALARLPRPAFLDLKHDPWAVADRAAWDEAVIDPHPRLAPAVATLTALLRPTTLPSQVIHGDFFSNVLFADGLPPAVIDMSPYFRPASFAIAVTAFDALVWYEAPPTILDDLAAEPDIDQMLVRAALRRVLELDGHWRQNGRDLLAEVDAYAPAIGLIASRVQAGSR